MSVCHRRRSLDQWRRCSPWALDWHGMNYEEINWPPGVHQTLRPAREILVLFGEELHLRREPRTVPTRCLTSSWRKSSASSRFAEENRPNPADEAPVVMERKGSENGRTLHFPVSYSAQQIVLSLRPQHHKGSRDLFHRKTSYARSTSIAAPLIH